MPLFARGGSRPVFGPETFTTPRVRPGTFERGFAVQATGSFSLCLAKGDPEDDDGGKNRRSERCEEVQRGKGDRHGRDELFLSGRVLVDGEEVVSRRDFGKHEDVIERSLRLSPGPHRLTVELDGTPGSRITLAITAPLGKLREARAGHSATLRPDGSVLFAGGVRDKHDVLGSAELFDPTTFQSTLLPSRLNQPRTEHSATLVPSGEVLLAAGRAAGGVLSSTELAQGDGTFGPLDSIVEVPRAGHSATLLPDGRVVILGGLDASRTSLDQGEAFESPSGVLYDPHSGVFTLLPRALAVPRHHHTATLLPDGRILVIGGRHEDDLLRSAELFDPATGEGRLLAARLGIARRAHTASLLNDGRVLIAGGRTRHGATDSVEVFDPATRAFTSLTQKLRQKRYNHTATVLPGGEILIAGGWADTNSDDDRERNRGRDATRDTELYLQPGRDTQPPTTLDIQPAPGATDVSSTPLIAIRFSEPIDVTTLTSRTLTLTEFDASGSPAAVAGSVSPGEEGLLAFFVPAAPLAAGTTYTLTLQGLTDRAGNALPSVSSQFTTAGAPPELVAFSPISGAVGTSVVLTGRRFDPVAANNQVTFNGIVAPVSAASATSITTAVPPGATTGPISVTTAGGTAVSDADFTVLSAPTISSIDPTSGAAGTPVTIIGTGFVPNPAANQVVFSGNAPAVPTSATSTQLVLVVPRTAQSGPITVTNAHGAAQSPPFTVRLEQDFDLVASPASVTLLHGATVAVTLQLASTGTRQFEGLARLSAVNLPSGVTATFTPHTLSGFQTGQLVFGAGATATPGTYPIQIKAEYSFAGIPVSRGATIGVAVQPSNGVTGVKGRFVTPDGVGIAGVIVRADISPNAQPQTATDAAGNFLLTGLPAGSVTLRFDATPANPLYPIWPYTITLAANQLALIADWTIAPPPPAERFTPINNATQDQVITDPRYPGLEIKLPAGVTITGWDNVPKTRIAVERHSLDRLPVSPPPTNALSAYQLYFGTPMGGVPSAPIPVTLPNDVEAEPGDPVDIWFFDGSPMGGSGEWKIAGQGIASPDGKTLRMPDGTGIPRFCGVCGLMCAGKATPPPAKKPKPSPPPPCKPTDPCCQNNQGQKGKAVTLAAGQELMSEVDLSCRGVPSMGLSRTYNPLDAFNNIAGTVATLGLGWVTNYDIVLLPFDGPQKRLVLPSNDRVNFVDDGSGQHKSFDDPRFDGAVLSQVDSSTWQVKLKDGVVWRFTPFPGIPGVIRGGPPYFLIEETDPRGNSLQIARNSVGRAVAIGTPHRALNLTYGANGFVSHLRDPLGRTVQYTYTPTNRLESVTGPDGGVTRYTYADDGEFPATPACPAIPGGERIKTIQRPGKPQLQVLHYGPSRRVLREVLEDGSENRFSYTLVGACVTHASNPIVKCAGPACPTEDSWDNFQAGWRISGGTVTAATFVDANGGRSVERFNAQASTTEAIDETGQSLRYAYDTQNRRTQVTDTLGRTWQFTYDAKGNVTRTVDPILRQVDIAYDGNWNKPTSVTRYKDDNSPVVTLFQYDAVTGNLLSVTDPLGHVSSYTYTPGTGNDKPKGVLRTIRSPLGQLTTFDYNAAGDLVTILDPLNHEIAFTPDSAGRVTEATDALGHTQRMAYTAIDQLERSTDPLGGEARRTYHPTRKLRSVINPLNNTIEAYEYDALDRLIQTTDAKNNSAAYQYNSNGNLIRIIDRKGQPTTLNYDERNLPLRVTFADGEEQARGYDLVGRLVEIREGNNTITFSYDTADRVVKVITETAAGLADLAYEYDSLDRVVRRTLTAPGLAPEATTYDYDDASRLISIGYRGQTTIYDWDDANRLMHRTLPNGIKQAFQYDDANRLTQIQYKRSDDTAIETIAYTYDANGNPLSKSTSTASVRETGMSATYDEADRLTSLTLTNANKTYTLAYDDNGNLASKTDQANPADTTTHTWDARDRLVAITGPGVAATFEYDALGRRISRAVNGQTVQYVYDGLHAIGEIANGAISATLLTGLQIDEVLARYTQVGSRTFLTDALGSVLAQARDDQSIQNHYAYTPYGETTALGSDDGNPIQYTARENDSSGLYFYRTRYYDPVLKRLIAEDPIGLAGGLNAYVYAGGNPLAFVDVSGEAPSRRKPHSSNARPSAKEKHENADARGQADYGGEKGDARRDWPRQPPYEPWPGQWPPTDPDSKEWKRAEKALGKKAAKAAGKKSWVGTAFCLSVILACVEGIASCDTCELCIDDYECPCPPII